MECLGTEANVLRRKLEGPTIFAPEKCSFGWLGLSEKVRGTEFGVQGLGSVDVVPWSKEHGALPPEPGDRGT